jgi:hypothetical protein
LAEVIFAMPSTRIRLLIASHLLFDAIAVWLANVTDAGLEHTKGLIYLQALNLANTRITDAGLEHLRAFPNLTVLRLNGTNVSDAGLMKLQGLSQLRELHLAGTQITDAGIQKLRQALPGCKTYK